MPSLNWIWRPSRTAHEDAPLPGGLQVDGVIGHPLGVDELQVGQGLHQLVGDGGDGVYK